jgi:3',5'-cyclic AMP phosphodiesterase CpdA
MTQRIRLAITADLHWGHNSRGDEATRQLRDFVRQRAPDVLVLAGDVGAGQHFNECLALFRELTSQKALVPGNHDVWVTEDDARGDSLTVYQRHLPAVCAEYGFHFLDHRPLIWPDSGLALVGTINWYDYSWSLDALRALTLDWEERLRTKRFSRARHNDARFVRWPTDDVAFTARVVSAMEEQLREALKTVPQAVVVTHHPPFRGLSLPDHGPDPSLDELLWDAFMGNQRMEDLLTRNSSSVPLAFCGHTHVPRESTLVNVRGYNIGSDYHTKRLLLVDWPSRQVEARSFDAPATNPS